MIKGKCAGCGMMRRKNVCHKHSLREVVRGTYTKFKKENCEKCGTGKKYDNEGFLLRNGSLTVHHIDGNIMNNKKENLMTLCRKCHDEIDGIKPHKKGKKYYY